MRIVNADNGISIPLDITQVRSGSPITEEKLDLFCVAVKTKELEDLAEAVGTENHRLYALQEQRKYGSPLIHA